MSKRFRRYGEYCQIFCWNLGSLYYSNSDLKGSPWMVYFACLGKVICLGSRMSQLLVNVVFFGVSLFFSISVQPVIWLFEILSLFVVFFASKQNGLRLSCFCFHDFYLFYCGIKFRDLIICWSHRVKPELFIFEMIFILAKIHKQRVH